ncbi:MAG: RnfABCDGE type electron transport complex subunit C, partial [Gammaproteobacteria bacterium]|nr:RnfABCDGE type electron transport complex subunit C [Gammaproteobacteria bacterium]
LIVNGVECEPFITCDERNMYENAETILRGCQWAQRAAGAKTVWFTMRDDMTTAIKTMRAAIEQLNDPSIQLILVSHRYPQGSEHQLIESLTGQPQPANTLPQALGLVMINVGTATAIERAARGLPLTSRLITICGEAVPTPGNYRVRIGTTLNDLLRALDMSQLDLNALDIIVGGPLTGRRIDALDIAVTKGTQCVLINHTEAVAKNPTTLACIRCGSCDDVCPQRLSPQSLYRQAPHQRWSQMQALDLDQCIECGCCDLVCPSQLPLTRVFKDAKTAITQQTVDQTRSHKNRQRFEAKQARVASTTLNNQLTSPLAVIAGGRDPKQVIDDIVKRSQSDENMDSDSPKQNKS